MSRAQLLFGALVLAQAAHSVEEYVGRLWESLPPARWLSGLVSPDLATGFLILNVSIFLIGAWAFLWPVRRTWPSARTFMWIWAIVEISNGLVHPGWSILQRTYIPGTLTAPVLLVLGLMLARTLSRSAPSGAAAAPGVPAARR